MKDKKKSIFLCQYPLISTTYVSLGPRDPSRGQLFTAELDQECWEKQVKPLK